ncbi:DUF4199 domain-containing protein [Tunicatimonas pelagia]|uniref:DUF4199 domain-containing protein n=1 Tax=Tunicatimonas pelagia TaxID=931531 RepID=UPI002666B0AB|nr:DUF4199 domain-containing protein [Tunicatimonas pelagia]WKN42474.1 DUF4199 domain-containing protein [Tunicatimonas pelagia]
MERKMISDTIERLSFRYGILMALALAGFFFLMKAFGLEHNLELRAFNLVILISFVLMAIKDFKKRKSNKLSYLKGLGLGILTTIVGTVSFAIMVVFYLSVVNPSFMGVIQNLEPFGDFLNPLLVGFTIIIEGMASGCLATYGIMQFFKPSRVLASAEVHD